MASRPARFSKKWRMTCIALQILGIIFFSALAVMWQEPRISADVVALAKIVIAALTVIAAGYCGCQAHADSKTAEALGNSQP